MGCIDIDKNISVFILEYESWKKCLDLFLVIKFHGYTKLWLLFMVIHQVVHQKKEDSQKWNSHCLLEHGLKHLD